MKPPDQITIRRPTGRYRTRDGAPAIHLGRSIKGLRVGIRTDHMWRSWLQVAEAWSEQLRRDGAEPVVLRIGEHGGEEGLNTQRMIDEWANSVDCAIVGLAN